jgi:hypothetical protein
LEEFKKFDLEGNGVDLAVGIIIGVAFGVIIPSLLVEEACAWVCTTGELPYPQHPPLHQPYGGEIAICHPDPPFTRMQGLLLAHSGLEK